MEQRKESETVAPRNYCLNLSDADVKRIANKAADYNLTVAQLLENFIGDLVDGTYSNGSDERMLANEWADRCCFSYESERSLIKFFSGYSSYAGEEFLDILEDIEYLQNDIIKTEEEIRNPQKDWANIIYRKSATEVEPAYASLEEYLNNLREELVDTKNSLKTSEYMLADIKNDFAEYMGSKEYSWDDEQQKFQAWYKENVSDKLFPVSDNAKQPQAENKSDAKGSVDVSQGESQGEKHRKRGR
jgi:hypothetical protein